MAWQLVLIQPNIRVFLDLTSIRAVQVDGLVIRYFLIAPVRLAQARAGDPVLGPLYIEFLRTDRTRVLYREDGFAVVRYGDLDVVAERAADRTDYIGYDNGRWYSLLSWHLPYFSVYRTRNSRHYRASFL